MVLLLDIQIDPIKFKNFTKTTSLAYIILLFYLTVVIDKGMHADNYIFLDNNHRRAQTTISGRV